MPAVCILAVSIAHAQPPNVILILTDDQGYGDMACHGNPDIQTPNIDLLHDQSVRLTNFHVDPTCSPTRAALMSGQYATRVGVWLTYMGRHRLRADQPTLANYFQDSGYRTAVFGKWHLGDNYPFRPSDRGFDESLVHGGGVVGEAPDHWGNNYYDDTYLRNNRLEQVEGYCTDVWFSEAMRFIDDTTRATPTTRAGDRPFFVYLPTNAPHGPYHVPARYVKPYTGAGLPESRARFYACITSVDENIGRLRRHLQQRGLADNTLVIFMTDNGTAGGAGFRSNHPEIPDKYGWVTTGYNAQMRGKKGTPYEGGHRAACFIHWPDGKLN
ncbi:MAG: arylsulfatase, partial [Planctomycetota bacterium]